MSAESLFVDLENPTTAQVRGLVGKLDQLAEERDRALASVRALTAGSSHGELQVLVTELESVIHRLGHVRFELQRDLNALKAEAALPQAIVDRVLQRIVARVSTLFAERSQAIQDQEVACISLRELATALYGR